jgi:DNA gyrase subunit A
MPASHPAKRTPAAKPLNKSQNKSQNMASLSPPSSSVKGKRRVKTASKIASVSHVQDVSVSDELRSSFLSYALSVIVARALPDARDGLKPVHRRILYSLYSQRIVPTGPYKKSARVVGDTMAKYHPHSDSAIYESLVRMAQDFSMLLPLVDPHGNFGSLDDSPAASRYTECRLSPFGMLLLEGLDEDAVDFLPNYDGTESEPAVLPADFPNLLVNGSTGVAVGMATNIPPHNLSEVLDAAVMVLRSKKVTLDDVLSVLHGPDFPTGGEIVSRADLRELYATGRGNITVRARARVVDLSPRRKGIEVSELPYMVGPEKVSARIRDLVAAKRLPAVADVKDFSDRSTGLRLVIEVKSGFDPYAVLADLYRLTPMEEAFPASFVALVDGRPRLCSLLDLLHAYVDHRLDTLRRRCEYQLRRARERVHLQEALVLTLDDVDAVVRLIRSASDTAEARTKLMKKLKVDLVQADYILEMPLRRLTSLEVAKIKKELAALRKEIDRFSTLLASPKKLAAAAAASLAALREQYPSVRRTALKVSLHLPTVVPSASTPGGLPAATDASSAAPVLVGFTYGGTLARIQPGLGRAKPTVHDALLAEVLASPDEQLLAITASGFAYPFLPTELPEAPRASGGIAPVDCFDDFGNDAIIALLPTATPVLLFTAAGVVKRLDPSAYPRSLHTRFSLISLAPSDHLVAASALRDDPSRLYCVYVSSSGVVLRHLVSAVRPQQRAAGGVTGFALADKSRVLAAAAASDDLSLWVATDQGAVKGVRLGEFPAKGRATSGMLALRFRSGEAALRAAAFGNQQAFSVSAQVCGPMPSLAARTHTAQVLEHEAAWFASLRP